MFVSLPTGFGKSIIYALLPYAFDVVFGEYIAILLFINHYYFLCRKIWQHCFMYMSSYCIDD